MKKYTLSATENGDLQVTTGIIVIGYIYKQFHGDILFYRAVYHGVTHIESMLCNSRKAAYHWIVSKDQAL